MSVHRYDAVKVRPSVQATIVDEQELVLNYAGYADGSATSDVAMRFGGAVVGTASSAGVTVPLQKPIRKGPYW